MPREDEPRMLRLTQELFGATDPDLRRKDSEHETEESRAMAIQATLADFFNYFNALTESRRANPRDDVASVVANAQIDGEQISAFDAVSYYVIIATAGHDTTSSSTGGAMWALAERPAELAKLKANPALIPGLVDESIRWTTPVRHFMRSAAAGHRGGRPPGQQGRLVHALLPLRQPRRDGVRRPAASSTSTAAPTATSPSATAPTSASASTWPRWRCASSGKSCCRA